MNPEDQSGVAGAPPPGGGSPAPDPGAAASQPRAPGDTNQPMRRDNPDDPRVPQRRINEIEARHRSELAALNARLEEQSSGNKAFQQRLVDAIQGKTGGEDPETIELRKQLFSLLGPNAEKLLGRSEDILALADSRDSLQASSNWNFEQLGARTLRKVDEALGTVLGFAKPEDFPNEERAAWRDHFISWAEQSPQRAAKYAREDPSLIADYAAHVEQTYVSGIRRRATINEESRRTFAARTPQGGGAAGASSAAQAPPRSAGSLEDLAKQAFRSLTQGSSV